MRAKDYLSQLFWIDDEIKALSMERETIFNLTLRRASITDMKVQSSRGGRPDDVFAQLSDYAIKIADKSDELTALKIKISELIDKVENKTSQTLLRYRYTIGYDWENVAKLMDYEVRHIYRLHGQALKDFQDVMECHLE
ncbi:DUF1492 domain-containing protein [Facklamia sp. P12945]|uniref:DUF1492 domain-containing protein n=1 Tax=unclassified Facklamia TaxID=2622293 RepID=UPI003D185E5A